MHNDPLSEFIERNGILFQQIAQPGHVAGSKNHPLQPKSTFIFTNLDPEKGLHPCRGQYIEFSVRSFNTDPERTSLYISLPRHALEKILEIGRICLRQYDCANRCNTISMGFQSLTIYLGYIDPLTGKKEYIRRSQVSSKG